MTKTFIKHDFQQKNMLNYFPSITKYEKKLIFLNILYSDNFLNIHKFSKNFVRCGKFCEKLNQNG